MAAGGFVLVVEDITERRAAEARIRYLARYDSLTGLPNRASFRTELERILARGADGSEHALLFVDLDQFKHTNDTLGHPCGDGLLCEVARRLKRIVRPTDMVARFGGDEFVVFQSLRAGKEEAAHLASRIIEAVSEVYEIEHHEILIGASIGIALAPRDATNADQLIKRADIALYSAKEDGRGMWRFFERDMDERAQERRSLEIDLRTALSEGQFELRYQPIIDLRRGRITSCEALLRWPHPDRGMVSPGEFIPIAEETGLITDIGKWVLVEACRECARWPEHTRVAVNLSPTQFRRADVCADVEHALKEAGLAPGRLEVEITESVFLQDTPVNLAMLQKLQEMGVRISLDDFGTGYSSLSYLQRFPLNKVKIDRSFLAGLEADGRSLVLLQGIARLSGELGMSVVVEGVETHEQLDLLARQEHITEVQGFLFSPPVTARDVRELIGAGRMQELMGVA
jgi:diguanylate cyclase (GGDEF)-like protein